MKIITIIGARPQFIKAAVVSRAIKHHNSNKERPISELIVHTGQHFDLNMSDIFFEEMDIPKPNRYLSINQMSHGAMTGRMLEKIEEILIDEKPDVVMVYGDTNSTLAGSLAAIKLHIPVAHVEAGLRSFNRLMPEEHNRVLTDHVSTFLFCPTEQAVENLIREGFKKPTPNPKDTETINLSPAIYRVGDVMYDAALFYTKMAQDKAFYSGRVIKNELGSQDFAIATIHREENTDDDVRFHSIVSAFKKIAEKIPIIWPVHPRTQKRIKEHGIEHSLENSGIILIEPVGYFDMLNLLKKCKFVLTDSGGLQKEAYFFQKECITLRDETEWVELLEKGCNTVVGADTDKIVNAVHLLNINDACFDKGLYGSGNAGQKIITILNTVFS